MNSIQENLVSVIAVCFNHEKYLVETLNSIKNQTHLNIQLIIMEDCSTDNSVKMINDWITDNDYRCKFIAHKKNAGLCKTLNEALAFCKGEYVQIISCDDVLLNHKIQKQIEVFEHLDSTYGAIYSDGLLIDEHSKSLDIKFIAKHTSDRKVNSFSGNIFQELAQSNFIPAMSVLMKKEYIDKIGAYDERLVYEDYDYWLRLSKASKFHFVDEVLIYYRMHSENQHKKIKNWGKAFFLIGCKHLNNELFLERTQKLAIQLYYEENNREIINVFYENVDFNKLKRKLTHLLIKYNSPVFCVRVIRKIRSILNLKD